MPVKYISYFPETVQGQAILDNFTRTRRVLRYNGNDKVIERIQRGMPLYETKTLERIGAEDSGNLLIRGECLSACAYLKDKGIKIDLVYIDPPFASGADYAKKVFLRKNPKIAEALAEKEAAVLSSRFSVSSGDEKDTLKRELRTEAGEEIPIDEYRAFEEKIMAIFGIKNLI